MRLTPQAGCDSIDGIMLLSDGRNVLKARVTAAPSAGEANSALTNLLARRLRDAPRDVTVVGGAASRLTRILIKGDARVVAAALEEIQESAAR